LKCAEEEKYGFRRMSRRFVFAVEVGTLKFSFAQVGATGSLYLGSFKTATHKFSDPEFSMANPQFSKHVSPFFNNAADDRVKDVGLAAAHTFDIAGQRRPHWPGAER
jgi:hypothetical protein